MAAIISFTYDKALAKLCSKWKCVNNSNNLLLSERSEFTFFANAFPHLE